MTEAAEAKRKAEWDAASKYAKREVRRIGADEVRQAEKLEAAEAAIEETRVMNRWWEENMCDNSSNGEEEERDEDGVSADDDMAQDDDADWSPPQG